MKIKNQYSRKRKTTLEEIKEQNNKIDYINNEIQSFINKNEE